MHCLHQELGGLESRFRRGPGCPTSSPCVQCARLQTAKLQAGTDSGLWFNGVRPGGEGFGTGGMLALRDEKFVT